MAVFIPSWPWLDVTATFDYLWELLKSIWIWSDTCGIVLYGTYVAWRDVAIAMMVMAIMLRNLLRDWENDSAEAYSYSESEFYKNW